MTQEEKREIIREANGSLTSQNYGENKSVEIAQELGECEGIIPDIPTNLNDTIAIDIVGPLPITPRGYILSELGKRTSRNY